MINVRRQDDGSYVVVNGHRRLQVILDLQGSAEVVDTATGMTLTVHQVGEQLLAWPPEVQAKLEDLTAATIHNAKGRGKG